MTESISYEEAMKAATQEALRMTFERAMSLPPPQVVPYLTNIVQLGVELLRAGGKEDAFVRGFLEGVLSSLDSPPTLTMKDVRVN